MGMKKIKKGDDIEVASNVKVMYFDDEKRVCDCCGKMDYLMCISWKLGRLFGDMPPKHTAVWFCKDCCGELLSGISSPHNVSNSGA